MNLPQVNSSSRIVSFLWKRGILSSVVTRTAATVKRNGARCVSLSATLASSLRAAALCPLRRKEIAIRPLSRFGH